MNSTTVICNGIHSCVSRIKTTMGPSSKSIQDARSIHAHYRVWWSPIPPKWFHHLVLLHNILGGDKANAWSWRMLPQLDWGLVNKEEGTQDIHLAPFKIYYWQLQRQQSAYYSNQRAHGPQHHGGFWHCPSWSCIDQVKDMPHNSAAAWRYYK